MEQLVKKAIEYCTVTQSINPATAPEFWGRINDRLTEGWDVFASQSIGLDTGGGVSGGGSVMMVVTLVRYDYRFVKPVEPPQQDAVA